MARNKTARKSELVGHFAVELFVNGVQVPEVEVGDRQIAICPWDCDYTIRLSARPVIKPGQRLYIPPNKYYAVKVTVDCRDVKDGECKKMEDCGGFVIGEGVGELRGFILPADVAKDGIARFRFGRREDSYAMLMEGDPANIGVIGMAIYEGELIEVPKPPPVFDLNRLIEEMGRKYATDPYETERGGDYVMKGGGGNHTYGGSGGGNRGHVTKRGSSSGSRSPSVAPTSQPATLGAAASGHSHSLGTEFGKRDTQKFEQTPFQLTSPEPVAVISLEYMTEADARHNGIQPPASLPKPFSGCKLPPNWQG